MTETSMGVRAVLEPDELAHLLRIVEAGPILGLDNDEISRADSEAGLDRLKTNGWMQQDGGGWNLANHLYLMAAVISEASRVLTITRLDGGERTAAFYGADRHLVEVFRADEGYVLSLSQGSTRLVEYAEAVMAGTDGPNATSSGVRLPAPVFERIFDTDDGTRRPNLVGVFERGGVESATAQRWAEVIVPHTATVKVQAVGLLARQLVLRRDLYAFGSPAVLVAGGGGGKEEVVICDHSPEAFTALLSLVWQVVEPNVTTLDPPPAASTL